MKPSGSPASAGRLQSSRPLALSFALIVACMIAGRTRLFDVAVLSPNNPLTCDYLCLHDCLNLVKVPRSKIVGVYPHIHRQGQRLVG